MSPPLLDEGKGLCKLYSSLQACLYKLEVNKGEWLFCPRVFRDYKPFKVNSIAGSSAIPAVRWNSEPLISEFAGCVCHGGMPFLLQGIFHVPKSTCVVLESFILLCLPLAWVYICGLYSSLTTRQAEEQLSIDLLSELVKKSWNDLNPRIIVKWN